MKKIFLVFLLAGCTGTRTVQLQKDKTTIKTDAKATTNTLVTTQRDIAASINIEATKRLDFGEVFLKEKDSQHEGYQHSVNAETEKLREYYENGNLKTERETTKTLSEVVTKKARQLEKVSREANIKLAEKDKVIQSYKEGNEALTQKYNDLQLKYSELQKTKSKDIESKRPSFWFYVLIFILGGGTGFYISGRMLKL